MGTQFAGIKTSMSDVAAASAGNSDFGKELCRSLDQGDACSRRGFRASDSGKEASRATAYDDDLLADGLRLETNGKSLKR